MKKIVLSIALLLPLGAFSQQFILTPDNFKEKSNTEKNYYVLEVQGKSKEDLFKSAKMYFAAKYTGIKNAGFNEVGTDQIVIDFQGYERKTIIINPFGANVWSATTRFEINFKDSKVMIKPSFSELKNTIDIGVTAGLGSLYKSNGEPKKEKGITFVESQANQFIAEFTKSLQENSKDW